MTTWCIHMCRLAVIIRLNSYGGQCLRHCSPRRIRACVRAARVRGVLAPLLGNSCIVGYRVACSNLPGPQRNNSIRSTSYSEDGMSPGPSMHPWCQQSRCHSISPVGACRLSRALGAAETSSDQAWPWLTCCEVSFSFRWYDLCMSRLARLSVDGEDWIVPREAIASSRRGHEREGYAMYEYRRVLSRPGTVIFNLCHQRVVGSSVDAPVAFQIQCF